MFHLAVAFAYERFSFLFTLAPRRVYQPSQRPLLICPMKPEVCTLPAEGIWDHQMLCMKIVIAWTLRRGSGAGLESASVTALIKLRFRQIQINEMIISLLRPTSSVFELFPSHYKIPKCWTKKRKFFCFAYPDFFQSKRTLNNFMGRRFNAECDECFERQDF